MYKLLTEQLVSVSQLQRNYHQLIEKSKRLGAPLLLLNKNKLEAVLLGGHLYEALKERLRELEEKLALEAINDYQKEKEQGKLKKLKKMEELFG